MAVFGPRALIFREQFGDLPAATSVAPEASAETLEIRRIWRNLRGSLVNNRDFWSEDARTLAVTQSEVSSAVYGNHVILGWNDFATTFLGPFASTANWAVSHAGGQTFNASVTGLPTGGIVLGTRRDPAGEAEYNSVAVDRALQSNAIFAGWSDNRNGDADIFFYKSGR